MVGSTDVYNFYHKNANDLPMSVQDAYYGNPWIQAQLSMALAELYEEKTEKKADTHGYYDYRITVDSAHKNSDYCSYLWIDKNGNLMEKPIIYPKDKVIIGHTDTFKITFEPLIIIPLGNSHKASEEYQEIFKKYYYDKEYNKRG